jgi:hypothetical protein
MKFYSRTLMTATTSKRTRCRVFLILYHPLRLAFNLSKYSLQVEHGQNQPELPKSKSPLLAVAVAVLAVTLATAQAAAAVAVVPPLNLLMLLELLVKQLPSALAVLLAGQIVLVVPEVLRRLVRSVLQQVAAAGLPKEAGRVRVAQEARGLAATLTLQVKLVMAFRRMIINLARQVVLQFLEAVDVEAVLLQAQQVALEETTAAAGHPLPGRKLAVLVLAV